jgi:hypothetical protein
MEILIRPVIKNILKIILKSIKNFQKFYIPEKCSYMQTFQLPISICKHILDINHAWKTEQI